MKEQPLLEVKNLTTYFYNKNKKAFLPIIENITFDIKEGEVVALFGESGSGKTQTAYSIMGLVHHLQGIINGEIWFKGENLLAGLEYNGKNRYEVSKYRDFCRLIRKSGYEEKMRRIRGKEIFLVMQGAKSALNPFQKIRTQIEEAYLINNRAEKTMYEKLDIILKKLHIYEKAKEYPHNLSGGMCQRAIIAMAIAANPTLLIADEPTTGIDPPLMIKIIELLKGFVEGTILKDEKEGKDKKRTLLFISHDLKVVEKLADKVVVMYAGEVVEKGKKEILTDKKAKHPYTKMLIEAYNIEALEGQSSEEKHSRNELIWDYSYFTTGCKFYNKCSIKREICLNTKPTLCLIDSELEHEVRCFNWS